VGDKQAIQPQPLFSQNLAMLWTFFAVALPLTFGAVVATLLHYASPKVMQHVKVVVIYAWFVNVSIVILTPVDVWTVRS